MDKKKDRSIKRIFTNKKTMNTIVFIVFIILIYILYSLLYNGSNSEGENNQNNLGFGSFLGYLGYFLLFVVVLLVILPSVLFLIFSKRESALKPEERVDPRNLDKHNRPEEIEEDTEKEQEQDDGIPEFNFDTHASTSNCPAKDNIEEFMIRKSKKQKAKEKVLVEKKKMEKERIHVDGTTGRMSGSRSLKGEVKKIELPEYPNVNNDKWIHISKIPDMKNYVHKKDLPCMSNYVHKKEIPNMSEYVHKTKIPPIKPLKKTSELPDDLDTVKIDDIKKVYGIDMNNYILKTSIPKCLKCPDINDYVLKSSVPPF